LLLKSKHITNQYLSYLTVSYVYANSFRIFYLYYQNTIYAYIVFIIALFIGLLWVLESYKIDKENSFYLLPYLFGISLHGLEFLYC